METTMKTSTYILLTVLSLGLYVALAHHIARSDLGLLLGAVGLTFLCYIYFIERPISIAATLVLGLLFRAVFALSVPTLSQDFYRFIWDGELFLRGISPYTYLPEELIYLEKYHDLKPLYEGMGPSSARNFSNYPMLNQWLFTLGSLSAQPRLIFRFIIVLADLAVFGLLFKLIRSYRHKQWALTAYFLNPLVIIEGTHNLHFEPVMLAFLLAFLHAIKNNQYFRAGLFFGASVFTKLLPLMLAPLLLRWLQKKALIRLGLSFLVLSLLLIIPFSGPLWAQNWGASIGLWFSNFEFNGAIYPLFKRIGLALGAHDYQLIDIYGYLQVLGLLVLAGFFGVKSTSLNKFIRYAEWLLLAYLLSSPTIHPWYLITLIGLACLRRSTLVLVWSGTIFISYSAYGYHPVEVPLWITALEYVPLLLLFARSTQSFSRSLPLSR